MLVFGFLLGSGVGAWLFFWGAACRFSWLGWCASVCVFGGVTVDATFFPVFFTWLMVWSVVACLSAVALVVVLLRGLLGVVGV